jgi:adenylosuccinate lyase
MSDAYETYQSPFTWRYGSQEMRRIWSEAHKRRLWRKIWVALAEVQASYGLVKPEQVADLRAHMDQVDVTRALQVEAEIRHDLMAELKVFAEQAAIGGGALHLGATSTDIEDNADVLRMRQSLKLILEKLRRFLLLFAAQITTWADVPLIAMTHLQPAEPSTLGYRLAQYAQDLFQDWRLLDERVKTLKGKGFKGAVGTGAAYAELLGEARLEAFEAQLSQRLELDFYPITTQVYPRRQDLQLASELAGMGATLYKFAFDLRFLQSPNSGELGEPFAEQQVGSSAMPFKRNPIQAEKIDSLARELAQMPRLAWDNAAHSLLERTLDDSANRRSWLPEAFLICDELLSVASHILEDLQVDATAIERNLNRYGPLAAVERVLMALGKAGADRQEMHARLRRHTLETRAQVQAGQAQVLVDRILQDGEFLQYLSRQELGDLVDFRGYVGAAPRWSLRLADELRSALEHEGPA